MTERKREDRPVVLLDLDDTLLDFKKAEKIAVSKALREIGVEPTDAITSRYSEINVGRWQLMELGLISREEVLVGRFTQLFNELGVNASAERMKERYERFLAIGHYFVPGAEELIHELYGKYRLVLCSNGTAQVQSGRLASAGIAKYFDNIFISELVGHHKPSREYFDYCFSEIKSFDRSRAIMVGDSLSSDVKGGINAGILTCWFNPKGRAGREDIKPDYEISELAQLPPLLDRIFADKK